MKRLGSFIALVLFSLATVMGQVIPDPIQPPRLVNDLANIFTPEQVVALEEKLRGFEDKTTNEIVVVTVNEIDGDVASSALKIMREWGIGKAAKNNGVVILLKPTTEDSGGQVYIAVGYGLEGVLPDSKAGRIIDHKMIPHLKETNYYHACVLGAEGVMEAIGDEFVKEDKKYKYEYTTADIIQFILLGVAVFILFIYMYRKEKQQRGKDDDDDFTGGGGGGSQHRHSTTLPPIWGRFGGSSRGGGSWGGGGFGGFGGFGGGSGGGGGAGRSF